MRRNRLKELGFKALLVTLCLVPTAHSRPIGSWLSSPRLALRGGKNLNEASTSQLRLQQHLSNILRDSRLTLDRISRTSKQVATHISLDARLSYPSSTRIVCLSGAAIFCRQVRHFEVGSSPKGMPFLETSWSDCSTLSVYPMVAKYKQGTHRKTPRRVQDVTRSLLWTEFGTDPRLERTLCQGRPSHVFKVRFHADPVH